MKIRNLLVFTLVLVVLFWLPIHAQDSREVMIQRAMDMIDEGIKDLEKTRLPHGLLTKAVKARDVELIEQYISNYYVNIDENDVGESSWTPLLWAVDLGYKEIVEILIDNGADMTRRYPSGDTLLSRSIAFASLGPEYSEIMRLLVVKSIEKDIDIINQREGDATCMTPLMVAVTNNNEDAVRFLLDNNPDTKMTSCEDKTDLDYALEIGNERIINLLRTYPPLPSSKK